MPILVGGVFGRAERIRTSDPLLPKQVRYQAAPQPDRAARDSAEGVTWQGGGEREGGSVGLGWRARPSTVAGQERRDAQAAGCTGPRTSPQNRSG